MKQERGGAQAKGDCQGSLAFFVCATFLSFKWHLNHLYYVGRATQHISKVLEISSSLWRQWQEKIQKSLGPLCLSPQVDSHCTPPASFHQHPGSVSCSAAASRQVPAVRFFWHLSCIELEMWVIYKIYLVYEKSEAWERQTFLKARALTGMLSNNLWLKLRTVL